MMENAISDLLIAHGFVALAVLMFLNGSISAPPSELILCIAGILARASGSKLLYVLVAAVAGNVLGAVLVFFLGAWLGEQKILRLRARLAGGPTWCSWIHFVLPDSTLMSKCRVKVRSGRIRWLFYLRCVPIVRSVISIPAGVFGVKLVPFCLLTLGGCTIWASIWVTGGFFIGKTMLAYGKMATMFVAIVITGLLSMVIYRTARHKIPGQRTDDP